MKRIPSFLSALTLAATLALCAAPAWAGVSKGQLLYVPCSSHVYHGVKTRPFELTVTLTVRNTDPWRAMKLTAVDYHGSDGRLIRRYLEKVVTVPPLATPGVHGGAERHQRGRRRAFPGALEGRHGHERTHCGGGDDRHHQQPGHILHQPGNGAAGVAYSPSRARAKSSPTKGRRSSIFSPRPTKLIGSL